MSYLSSPENRARGPASHAATLRRVQDPADQAGSGREVRGECYAGVMLSKDRRQVDTGRCHVGILMNTDDVLVPVFLFANSDKLIRTRRPQEGR